MKAAIAIGHGQNYEEAPQTTGLSAGYESAAARNLNGQDETLRKSRVNESTAAQHFLNQDEISGQPTVSVRSTGPLEEDPHVPKGRPGGFSPINYQTKVADPIALGGEEAGIEPLLDHFQAVSFYQETNPGPTNPTSSTVPENPHPFPESPNESQPSITHHTTSTEAASAGNTISPKDGSAQNANDTPASSAPPVGPTGTVPDKGISVKGFVSDSGKGVVERIKGAVGSLLRKGGESRASPGADCQSRAT